MSQVKLSDLVNNPVFNGMQAKEVQHVISLFSQVKVATGKTIFVENMPGEALYLVQEGNVQISQLLAEVDEQNITVIGAGDIFGELAVIDGGDRYATARVIESAVLFVLKRKDYSLLLTDNPRLGLQLTLNIVRIFSAKMRNAKNEYRTMLHASFNRNG